MRKRLFRDDQSEGRLSLTSMIDVTFLLLLFVLCTLKFRTLEGKLESHLPKTVGTGPGPSEQKERLSIEVVIIDEGSRVSRSTGEVLSAASELRFDYRDRRVAWRVPGHMLSSIEELEAYLLRAQARDSETEVSIEAREGVLYGEVVQVLDLVTELGLAGVAIRALPSR